MDRFIRIRDLLKGGGFFVSIEGADGLGKTTVCKGIEEVLPFPISVLKFPSKSNNFGAMVREMLNEKIPFDPVLMQTWQYGDKLIRQQQISSLLKAGSLVLGDRYSASTLAYGLSDMLSLKFCQMCIRGLIEPDLTIILDGESFKDKGDVYEERAYQVKVRNRYQFLAREYNWEIVEANRSEEEVLTDILSLIEEGLELRENSERKLTFCRCIENLCGCTYEMTNADRICNYCKDGLHSPLQGKARDIMIKYGILKR